MKDVSFSRKALDRDAISHALTGVFVDDTILRTEGVSMTLLFGKCGDADSDLCKSMLGQRAVDLFCTTPH